MVVMRNGREDDQLQGITTKQFLELYSVATYTTARTVGRVSIFDFDAHVSRLARLCERASIAMSDERMRDLVLPTLRQAMSAFLARFPDHERDELRIYFLAAPSPVPGAGEQGSDVDVLIYVQALPVKQKGELVTAALRPAPRRADPHVKDVKWNVARKVYEALQAKDEEEVIMYDEDGLVTEGLSSNVFVIAEDTVCTAPTDVVLAGTFRSLVLEVCAENHIPISLHCPQVSTIDRWQSVFITSTTRVVMGVGTLRYYVRGPVADPADARVLRFEPTPLLTRLTDLVAERMKERATTILHL